MTEDTEDDDIDKEVEPVEHETIDLTVPLDAPHQSVVEELEENGIDVERVASQQIRPQVEQLIHQLFQRAKYGE